MTFFTAALLTRLAFPHVESRLQIGGFILAVLVLEASRLAFPDRISSLYRIVFGAIGAVVGVITMRIFAHAQNL